VDILPLPAFALLGSGWQTAGTFARFAESLPPDGVEALAGISGPEDLWRAEARWWAKRELDALRLMQAGLAHRGAVIGAVALLAADARRVTVALEAAARRGLPGVEEALDEAA
jgi:hypothetical protein